MTLRMCASVAAMLHLRAIGPRLLLVVRDLNKKSIVAVT
jgi:hypothetical protein